MLTENELQHLRGAIEVSRHAREHGNGPFGAVLVDANGKVILSAENTQVTERDCTGHAETNLVREATRKFDRETLTGCTLYTSCEPCPMCAGAIYWSGVRRVVYALSQSGASRVMNQPSPSLDLSCRAVLASGRRHVEADGPALEKEAGEVFAGWK